MAPEQGVDARQADGRSDIYSLGCTLFFLLTGEPLFKGPTFMARMLAHQKTPAPSLSARCPDAPADLDRVFQKMVAKRPAERIQSMADVVTQLTSAADHLRSRHRDRGFRPRSTQLIALGVCGVLVAACWIWVGMLPENGEHDAEHGHQAKPDQHLVKDVSPDAMVRRILLLGGTPTVVVGESEFTIEAQADIPKGPYCIEKVDFDQCETLTDEHLDTLLPSLSDLKCLKVANTDITGRVFYHLPPNIETLGLEHTQIQDDDPQHLSGLQSLNTVWLVNTAIGDRGLHFLETSVTLTVYSKQLDRHEVSRLLDVQPTKAWNAGERHLVGTGRTGRTKIVDWGQWMLQIDHDRSPVDGKIRELLSRCTDRIEHWQALSHKYDIWLTIGGHMENWNREVALEPGILHMLADRGLKLRIDVYWYGDFEEDGE